MRRLAEITAVSATLAAVLWAIHRPDAGMLECIGVGVVVMAAIAWPLILTAKPPR